MNRKIKKIVYYFIIIILFIVFQKVIIVFSGDNKNIVINSVLELENKDLRKEIAEITNINYHDYDYIIGKITYHNLYDNDSYFIDTDEYLNNHIVLNNEGFIGILQDNKLVLTEYLNLGIKINDNNGILKKGKVYIIHGQYNEGDKVYANNINGINDDILIGYIKKVKNMSLEDIIDIDFIKIDSNYVVILK